MRGPLVAVWTTLGTVFSMTSNSDATNHLLEQAARGDVR
jgi:hypothetical protein